MALVIRMRQQGASNRQKFRIVVIDIRAPREGKYVEKLGWYNPFDLPTKNCVINVERLQFWMDRGAQISERVKSLVNTVAPNVVKEMVRKKVAKREKARVKRKAKRESRVSCATD